MRLDALFRASAMFLLLITGVELFACEMLALDQCETFGALKDTSVSGGDDACICCCTHIMVKRPSTFFPVAGSVLLSGFPELASPQARSVLLYRPPKV